MGLLLNSYKHTRLIELATGAGKTLMLAILAKYICKIAKKKVLVIVPSEVLRLDVTRLYNNNYCKAAASLYDPEVPPEVFYSTFENVLHDGRVLTNVILLVDEFHDFLKLPARITPNGISCPFSLIQGAYQVIGVSATFGGQ